MVWEELGSKIVLIMTRDTRNYLITIITEMTGDLDGTLDVIIESKSECSSFLVTGRINQFLKQMRLKELCSKGLNTDCNLVST